MPDENNIRDINAAKEAFIQSLESPEDGAAENPALEQTQDQTDLIDGVEKPEAVGAEVDEAAAAAQEESLPETPPEEPPTKKNSAELAVLQEIRDRLAQQSEQPAPEEEPEEPEVDPFESLDIDDFMEKISEDPKGTLKTLFDTAFSAARKQTAQEILEKVGPAIQLAQNVQDRDEATATFEQFFKENEDANDHLDGIKEYLSGTQLPLNDPRSLKEAYMASKLKKLEGLKPFEDYLKDDASVEKMLSDDGLLEKIFANPAFAEKARNHDGVKGSVIADYLSEIEQGKKPQTLTDGAGVPPATPPSAEPRTVREAIDGFVGSMSKK